MFDNKKPRPNTCAPRVRTTPTKAEKRLAERIAAYEKLSKSNLPTEYHRPGSKNLRNKG